MSNRAPIETSRYVQSDSEHTPTITLARLDEWFETEIQDLKALAIAAPTNAEARLISIRAGQVILMQEHFRAETFRALDKVTK
jgi:hypothetical protein